jgi:hypothetical protein
MRPPSCFVSTLMPLVLPCRRPGGVCFVHERGQRISKGEPPGCTGRCGSGQFTLRCSLAQRQ